jgi:N-acetyl-gamma-glutamyl-phosphate reductase
LSAPIDRGIFATVFVELSKDFDVAACFSQYYSDKPLIRIRNETPELRFVRGSAFADITTHQKDKLGVILIAIDNLGKGASSQALQATNLSYGFPETTGILTSNLHL